MQRPANHTSFARLSRPAAITVLSAAALMIALFVAISLSPWASGYADKPSRGASDVDLYNAEIHRIEQAHAITPRRVKNCTPEVIPHAACSIGARRCRCGWSGICQTYYSAGLLSARWRRCCWHFRFMCWRKRPGCERRHCADCCSSARNAVLVAKNLRDARGLGRRFDRAIMVLFCD